MVSMETENAILGRRSIRSFLEKPVGKEKIIKVLDAARLAPSARNVQPWHFIAVQEKGNREKVVATEPIFNLWMRDAPVLIVCCAQKGNKYSHIDLGLSIENMLLMATDLGLGGTTCAVHGSEKLLPP